MITFQFLLINSVLKAIFEVSMSKNQKEIDGLANPSISFSQKLQFAQILIDDNDTTQTPLILKELCLHRGANIEDIKEIVIKIKNIPGFYASLDQFIEDNTNSKSKKLIFDIFSDHDDLNLDLKELKNGAVINFFKINALDIFITASTQKEYQYARAAMTLGKLGITELLPEIFHYCCRKYIIRDNGNKEYIFLSQTLELFYIKNQAFFLEELVKFLNLNPETISLDIIWVFIQKKYSYRKINDLLILLKQLNNDLNVQIMEKLIFHDNDWRESSKKYILDDKVTDKQCKYILLKSLEKLGILVFGNLLGKDETDKEKEIKYDKVVLEDIYASSNLLLQTYQSIPSNSYQNFLIANFGFFVSYFLDSTKKRTYVRFPVKVPGHEQCTISDSPGFLNAKNKDSEVALFSSFILNQDEISKEISEKISEKIIEKEAKSDPEKIKITKLKACVLEIFSTNAACDDCQNLIVTNLLQAAGCLRKILNEKLGFDVPKKQDLKESRDKGLATSVMYFHEKGSKGSSTTSTSGREYKKAGFDETARQARRAYYSNGLLAHFKAPTLVKSKEKAELSNYTVFVSGGS
jgi:hypothetical protein